PLLDLLLKVTSLWVVMSASVVHLPKPTITIQPTDLVMWGQDVQITCSITGGEVGGSFIFTKTPGPFTQTVDSSSNSTILHIHQVNFTNEGSYQCQFQRADSSSVFSDYVNLNVTVILPKPSIAMDPAGVVTFGDLIAINCSISTQYLGGSFTLQKTSGSFTKTQQSSTNSSTFRFLEANDNHVGDYRCYYETLVEYKTFTSPLSDNVTVSRHSSLSGTLNDLWPEQNSNAACAMLLKSLISFN
uniref:Ig-like domain-containing protein n=1 Tax=Poecilia reticulata TaxID=8081 RepID=A0A3P9Q1T1_POERE